MFVVLVLLALLPLQAAALPALAMLCEQERIAAHDDPPGFNVEHDHHDGITPHPHADGDDGVGSGAHDHGNGGCHHHLYSAAPPVSPDVLRESTSSIDLIPLFSLTSCFPEQPQRPPLT